MVSILQSNKENQSQTQSDTKQDSVLITGICGGRGRYLARELLRSGVNVIGVDRRPWPAGKPENLELHPFSLLKRPFENLFRCNKIRAVVHLGLVSNPRIDVRERYHHNVNGTRQLLKYCKNYGVEKFILLSRGTVYGADPLNPVFMTEESPINASRNYAGMRDLIEVDQMTQAFAMGGGNPRGIILRPVYVVGPNIHNTFINYIRMPLCPTVLGYDPMIQLMHQEDVVEAILLALKHPEAQGIYNICGTGALPLSLIIREIGSKSIPIPHIMIYPMMKTLWKMQIVPAPAPEIDFIRYSCILDDSRIRKQLGYRPHFCLDELLRCLKPATPTVILD